MKRPELTTRDRRAVHMGAWLLGPMLLYGLVVRPYARVLGDRSDRLARERTLLARELAVLHDSSASRARQRALRDTLDRLSARLLDGADALAASAALASYVRDVADSSRLRLQRTETVAGDDGDVELDVRAEGDVGAIVAFLETLEQGATLVRVERLAIDRHAGDASPEESGQLTFGARLRGVARLRYAALAGETAPPAAVALQGDTADDDEALDDPFRPERGAATPETAADAAPVPPPPVIQLVGTVIVRGGGGVAVCRLATELPRMLHVGDSIAGMRLVAVEPSRATFRNAAGARVALEILKPGT